MTMRILVAALLAAGIALIGERLLFYRPRALAFWGALIEEVAKTSGASFLGAPLVSTHIVFGLLELVGDSLIKRSVVGGLVSLISHGVYGWITCLVWEYSGLLALAVGVATLVHCWWNYLVGRIGSVWK